MTKNEPLRLESDIYLQEIHFNAGDLKIAIGLRGEDPLAMIEFDFVVATFHFKEGFLFRDLGRIHKRPILLSCVPGNGVFQASGASLMPELVYPDGEIVDERYLVLTSDECVEIAGFEHPKITIY